MRRGAGPGGRDKALGMALGGAAISTIPYVGPLLANLHNAYVGKELAEKNPAASGQPATTGTQIPGAGAGIEAQPSTGAKPSGLRSQGGGGTVSSGTATTSDQDRLLMLLARLSVQ